MVPSLAGHPGQVKVSRSKTARLRTGLRTPHLDTARVSVVSIHSKLANGKAQRLTGRVGRHAGLLAVLALSILLNSYHLHWGLPNNETWSNDSISPEGPIEVVDVYVSGRDYYYPLLQSWINYAVSLPVLIYWSSTGKYDLSCRDETPQCFSDYYRQLSTLIILHRAVSVLMALGVLIGVYKLSVFLFEDRLAATFAAATVAFSNVFVLFSHLTNVDIPSLFWFTWSMLSYFMLIKHQAQKDYFLFGILSGCALSTKESLVGAYFLTGLFILFNIFTIKNGRINSYRQDGLKNIFLLLIALIGTYGLINNVWFNFSGFQGHMMLWFGADGGLSHNWAKELQPLQVISKMVDYAKGEVGVALLVFLLCGLLYGLRSRPREALWILLPVLSYALFHIFFIKNYLFRFSLPLIVLLAPLSGLLAARLLRMRQPYYSAGLAVVALVLGYSILNAVNSNIVMANDSRYVAERWIVKNIDPSSSLGVFSHSSYLPRVSMLGYSPQPIEIQTIQQQTEGHDRLPEYLIMVSKYYSRFPESFKRDLFGGKYGYEPIWSHQYRSALGETLGLETNDRLNPRVVILMRTK